MTIPKPYRTWKGLLDRKCNDNYIYAVLENICAKSFNQELLQTYSNRNHRQFAENLRELAGNSSGTSQKFCCKFFVRSSLKWLLFYIFSSFSRTFRQHSEGVTIVFNRGYSIKFLLTNGLFHTENIRT